MGLSNGDPDREFLFNWVPPEGEGDRLQIEFHPDLLWQFHPIVNLRRPLHRTVPIIETILEADPL
jgi:hypothetical protein